MNLIVMLTFIVKIIEQQYDSDNQYAYGISRSNSENQSYIN